MSLIKNIISDKINSFLLYSFGNESYGAIVDIIKGDEFIFIDAVSAKAYRIKLYNVETPEKGQKYYNSSIKFARKFLYKKEVKLSVYYFNKEFYVKIFYYNSEGNLKNYEGILLSQGLGFYKGDREDDQFLQATQTTAQQAKKNIWQNGVNNVVPPWIFREIQKENAIKKRYKDSNKDNDNYNVIIK
jgi:endonuclease YncB( thermonuclease family)